MAAKILIADDQPTNLNLLQAHLGPMGYSIVRANGGREALAFIASDTIDLVLLDSHMPDLNGIDVLKQIRASERNSHLPVVLVTGSAEHGAKLEGLEAGADEFLEKPVDSAILKARVRTLLRLRETLQMAASRSAELERMQRQQKELTEFIVHDLKNPIAVVYSNLDYALESLPATQSDIGEAMLDAKVATRRLMGLVEDLLSVARLEDLNLKVKPEQIAIAAMLHEIARVHLRETNARDLTLSVEADPTTTVFADAPLLRRVIENLVENSIRYTPPKGRLLLRATGSETAEIRVSNTGSAIAPEDRVRIFEKFGRGTSQKLARASVGIGLYFCKRAIEAHDGTIDVLESPEWPTTFVVRLGK